MTLGRKMVTVISVLLLFLANGVINIGFMRGAAIIVGPIITIISLVNSIRLGKNNKQYRLYIVWDTLLLIM